MPTDYRHPPAGLFVHRTRVWFDELDALGVLHHSRFVYHLERAGKALFAATMGVDTLDPQLAPDVYALVRDLEIRYVAPIAGEREILIALRVSRVRAAGLTLAFSFRSEDGAVLFAQGSRTVCRMSHLTGAPAEWTPEFRTRFGALESAGTGLATPL